MTDVRDMLRRLDAPRVDTRRVRRRPLRLSGWADLAAEVGRIEAAARAAGEGSAEFLVLGNWSAGQILQHLGLTIERSMDGFRARPSWEAPAASGLARLTGYPARSRIRNLTASARARLLGVEHDPGGPSTGGDGELEPWAQVWTHDGAALLRRALDRVSAGHRMACPSPTIGPLDHDEWTRFHLRHAELHLSFIRWRLDAEPA